MALIEPEIIFTWIVCFPWNGEEEACPLNRQFFEIVTAQSKSCYSEAGASSTGT